MHSLTTAGRNMYLLGVAELALYGFVRGDIGMSRPPMPAFLQGSGPAMAYMSGAILLGCVVCIYLGRLRAPALVAMTSVMLLLVTGRHLANLWADHVNGLKSLWLVAGAWVLLTSLDPHRRYRAAASWFALVVLSLFFVDCGVAHFRFPGFVKELVPTLIPFRLFFVYLAGVCLVAGGVGLLVPGTRRLAALLSGIMVGSWFLVVHLPRALTAGGDEWIGVGESLAVAGLCFMLRDDRAARAGLLAADGRSGGAAPPPGHPRRT